MTWDGLNMRLVFLMLEALREGHSLSRVGVASTLSRYARVLVQGNLIKRTAGQRSRYALTPNGAELYGVLSKFYKLVLA